MSKHKSGRASAYRQNQAEEVTLPSEAVVLLRRPPLQLWLKQGRFPQALLNAAISTLQTKEDREKAEAEAVAKLMAEDDGFNRFELLKFMVDVVHYAFVEPRLVEGGTGDDEMDPAELDPLDFNYAFQWATRTLPEQMVGKDLTVGAVDTFRQGGRDQSTADAGGDVPKLSDEAPV